MNTNIEEMLDEEIDDYGDWLLSVHKASHCSCPVCSSFEDEE